MPFSSRFLKLQTIPEWDATQAFDLNQECLHISQQIGLI
jgi:hypothetical protein